MANVRDGSPGRDLSTLFKVGVMGTHTDAQLLEWFTTRDGDTASMAFETLLARHGPMVLRVSRSILRDEHASEDSFQATFLVLARKARNLRVRDSLGPWLHAVACRVASCARSSENRRKRHERRVAETASSSGNYASPSDWVGVLHEEINRLPERYRQPLVLYYLEALTGEEAAKRLDWPLGTVRSRLARGRERLRVRLSRRGLAPATELATIFAAGSAQAFVPSALAKTTIRAAQLMVAGQLPAGAISAAALELMKGTIRVMLTHKLRNAAIVAALPLGVVIAYLGTLPGARAGGAPEAAFATGETTAEPDKRIASLLGTWKRKAAGSDDRPLSIKLLSADPGIAKGLGFEAPFVCTFTIVQPGKPDPRPYKLAFVDPAPTPPQITFLPLSCGASDSSSPEVGYPAIYGVEGGTLTLHLSNGRVPRPSGFEPPKDRTTQLEVYQRDPDKPPAGSK